MLLWRRREALKMINNIVSSFFNCIVHLVLVDAISCQLKLVVIDYIIITANIS